MGRGFCLVALAGRQWLRGSYIRNRLVAVAATGDRFFRRIPGTAIGCLHGRTVPRERYATATGFRAATSSARLCMFGIGSCRAGDPHSVRTTTHGARLSLGCNVRYGWTDRARRCSSRVFASANAPDGRLVSSNRTLGGNDGEADLLAWSALCGQYHRCHCWLLCCGLLSPASI